MGLDGGTQGQAGVEVDVLSKGQGDVGVRVVGVKSVVVGFVSLFLEHGCVFPHGHAETFVAFVHPHDVGAGSACPGGLEGIAMDGQKQIGLGFIGHFHPVPESGEAVVFAGVDDIDFGQIVLDVRSELQGNIQGDVFLCGRVSTCAEVARVFPAVACIEHQRQCRRGGRKGSASRHQRNTRRNDALFG